ncbi:flagellar basal body P-ring biosynthesis protein FlgA [Rickettsiales bacterium Ac37b]|nr:flagellar basal body P-ring biosynthesis protein FlgA [Rickettsiales bacterium Ac37b]
MRKILWYGNLWVKCFKKFILVCIIQIILLANVLALSDIDKQLKEDIKTCLRNEKVLFDNLNEDVQISYEISKKVYINWQEIDFSTTRITNINKKNRRFTGYIEVISPSLGKTEIPIAGQYEEYVLAPVLKSPMRSGEIIRINNIDNMRISISKLKSNTILDSTFLLNKTPKNSIAAYQVLTENQLVAPKIINKNDIVTAIYERGNLMLKLEVIALEAGARGELIKVKNQRSNAILNAIVEDRDKVRVK